tara:strand:- start:293 stop:433 length:141 start_codon:yes stop_codon:yes gene_type:complete
MVVADSIHKGCVYRMEEHQKKDWTKKNVSSEINQCGKVNPKLELRN